MKPWFTDFWNQHGERLAFMTMALSLCAVFWFLEDLRGDAKTGLIMILGILLNKIRSPREKSVENRPRSTE